MNYTDKTASELAREKTQRMQQEDRKRRTEKEAFDESVYNTAKTNVYESARDLEIERDKTKIKDEKPQEDTGKVAEYWNDALDFLGAPDALRAKEVKDGRTYDSRNKRSTIYDGWGRDALIEEIKSIDEDPDAKHVFYNIKYYTGKDENGNSTYAYKSGVDTVSAYNRYKEQLGSDVQIVFEKRFAGAEDAEHRLNQLNFEQGKTLATDKQEAYGANLGSFGSGYTEFASGDDFGGHKKTLSDFSQAREESLKAYEEDYDYRQTIDDNSGFYEGVLKGGDYGDALQSGSMSLVGGIGDAIVGVAGYGLNEIGLRNDIADDNMFQTLKDNADKYAGYDRKSSTAAIKESVALFKSGNYVEALWNNKFDLSDSIVESLPEMIATTASLPVGAVAKTVKGLNTANKALRAAQEAGDIAKVAKLTKEVNQLSAKFKTFGEAGIKAADTINSMSKAKRIANAASREVGFMAVLAKNTNNTIEERIANGDDDVTAGEFAGVLALSFLSTAADRVAFKSIIGDNKMISTARDLFKGSSEVAQKGILRKVAEGSASLTAAGATEGVQEYLQTWSEIVGSNLGVKGKTLDDVLSDEKLQDEALGAALAGTVGGVAINTVSKVPSAVKGTADTVAPIISKKLQDNNIHLEASDDIALGIKTWDDFNNDAYTPENKMLSLGKHFEKNTEHTIEYEKRDELIKNVIESVGSDSEKGKLFKQYITQKITDSIYDGNVDKGSESLSTARELGLDIDNEVYEKAVSAVDNMMNEIIVSEYAGGKENTALKSLGSDSITDRVDSPSEGGFAEYKPEPVAKDSTSESFTDNPMYGRFDGQILALNKQIKAMEDAGIDATKTKNYRDSLSVKNSQKQIKAKTFADVANEIAEIGFVGEDGKVDRDRRSVSQYKKILPLSVSSLGYDNNEILKRFVNFTKSRLSKATKIGSKKVSDKIIEENSDLLGVALEAKRVILTDKSLTSKQKKESLTEADASINNIMSSNTSMLDQELGRVNESLDSLTVNPELDGSYVVADEATTQLVLDDISRAKTQKDIEAIKQRISGGGESLPLYFNSKNGNDVMLAIHGQRKSLTPSGKKKDIGTVDTRVDYGKIHFVKNMKDWMVKNNHSKPINEGLFDSTMKTLLSLKDQKTREVIAQKLSGYKLSDEQIQTMYDVINYNKEDYTSKIEPRDGETKKREDLKKLVDLQNALRLLSAGILSKQSGLKSDELKEALEEAKSEIDELTTEIVSIRNSFEFQGKNLASDSLKIIDAEKNGAIRKLYLKALKIVKDLYSKLLKVKANKKEINDTFNYLNKIVKQIDKSGKVHHMSTDKAVSNIDTLGKMIQKRISNMIASNSEFQDDIKYVSEFENNKDAKVSKFAKNVKKKLTDKNSSIESKEKIISKFKEFIDNQPQKEEPVQKEELDDEEESREPAKVEPTKEETEEPTKEEEEDPDDGKDPEKVDPDPVDEPQTERDPNTIDAEWNTKEYRDVLNRFKVNFNNLKVMLAGEKNETSNAQVNKTLNSMKTIAMKRLKTFEYDLQRTKSKSREAIGGKTFNLNAKDTEIANLKKSLKSLKERIKKAYNKKDNKGFSELYVKMVKSEIRLQELTSVKSKKLDLDEAKYARTYIKDNDSFDEYLNFLNIVSKHNSDLNIMKSKALELIRLARELVKKFFTQKKKILSRIKDQESDISRIDEIIRMFNNQNIIDQKDMDFLESKFRAKQVKDQVDVRQFSNGERIAKWFEKHNPSVLTLFEPSNNPISKISSILTSGKNPSIIEQEFLIENISDNSIDKITDEDFANIDKLSKVTTGFTGSAHGKVTVDNGVIHSQNPNVFNIANLFTRASGSKTVTEANINRATKMVNGLLLSAIGSIKYDILKMDNDDIKKNFSISDPANIIAFKKDIANGKVPLASISKDISVELKNLIGLKIKKDSEEKNERLYDATLKAMIESIAKSNDMFDTETKQYTENKKYIMINTNDVFMDSNFTAEDISEIKNTFSKVSYIVGNRRKGKPTLKPQDIPTTVRNAKLKLSDSIKRKLKKLNSTPYNFSKNFEDIAIMYEHDKEAVYSLFKHYNKDELADMNIEDYITAVSNNEQTEREVDALYKYYKQIGDKDFYLPYGVTKSNRTQMFAEITPMESKIHREFVNKKSFTKTIEPTINKLRRTSEMTNDEFTDEEMFEIALSEAFDLDPDKKSRFQLFPDLRGIVNIYGTAGVEVNSDEYAWLKSFIENEYTDMSLIPKEVSRDLGIKAIHAAIELRKLHQAKINGSSKLTHDLTLEADAITSGTGLLSLQSGINGSNKELLEKAGIFTDEQLKDRTKYTKQLLAKKHNISEDDVTMSMPALIEAGDYHYDLIMDNKSGELDGIEDDYLYLDIYKTIGSDVMGFGFDGDKQDDSVNASKYGIEAFKLAKADIEAKAKEGGLKYFRKLSKPPVMESGYGSSISSIKKSLKNRVLQKMFLESLRGDRKYAHSVILEADARINKNAKNLKGKALKEYNQGVINKYWEKTSRNFNIPSELQDDIDLTDRGALSRYAIVNNKQIDMVLKEQSDTLLGDKFESAFDRRMPKIARYRETLRSFDVVHAETFKFLLEKEVEIAKRENIRELSFEERNDIAKRANNEPIESLEAEYKQRQGDRADKLSFAQLEGIVSKMNEDGYGYTLELFDRLQEFYKESDIDMEGADRSLVTDGYGNTLSVETRIKEFIANFRSYPTISIHNIDDEAMYRALKDNDFSSIYDAIIFPSSQLEVNDTTSVYNTEVIGANRDNSILDATVNKLSKMMKRIKELNGEDEFYRRFNMFEKKEVEVLDTKSVFADNNRTYARMIYSKGKPKIQFTSKVTVDEYIVSKNNDGSKFIVIEYHHYGNNDGTDTSITTYTKNEHGLYDVSFSARPINAQSGIIDRSGKRLTGELSPIKLNVDIAESSHESIARTHDALIRGKMKHDKYSISSLRNETDLKESDNIALKDNALKQALDQSGISDNIGDYQGDVLISNIEQIQRDRKELYSQTLNVNHMAVVGTKFTTVPPAESKDRNAEPDNSIVKEVFDKAGKAYNDGLIEYLKEKYKGSEMLWDLKDKDFSVIVSPMLNDKEYIETLSELDIELLKEYRSLGLERNRDNKFIATPVELLNTYTFMPVDYIASTETEVIPKGAMDIIKEYLDNPDKGC